MYDVTDKSSFEALQNWLNEAKEFGFDSSNSTLVVLGNKIDQYPRVVTEQQVRWQISAFELKSLIPRSQHS
jgi:GTPase SAR1 family protein